MPVVGRFTGGLQFQDYFIALASIPAGVPHTLEAVKKAGVPVLAWGSFVNNCLNFAILAFIVFLMVRAINRMRRREPPAPAAPPEQVVLLREIRDSLRAR
jgi:large conductance mechanosensitive channel